MPIQFEEGLAVTEHNKEAESSILLIHGGFATGREWDGVVKRLPQYHLIVPDLQGHGRSQVNGTHFNLHECVDKFAGITRKLAKNGKAYIVGLSLGAHIGAHLVSRYPDIVREPVLLSGFNSWPELNHVVFACPAWLMSRAYHAFASSASDEDSEFTRCSWQLCSQVARVIMTVDTPKPWPARTLIIAAAKKGPLPITDRDDNAIYLASVAQKLCPDTVAYKHKGVRHAWHKEEPQLFADTVIAWLNNKPLPDGFIKL